MIFVVRFGGTRGAACQITAVEPRGHALPSRVNWIATIMLRRYRSHTSSSADGSRRYGSTPTTVREERGVNKRTLNRSEIKYLCIGFTPCIQASRITNETSLSAAPCRLAHAFPYGFARRTGQRARTVLGCTMVIIMRGMPKLAMTQSALCPRGDDET